jgi:hypothetical protein
MNRIIIEAVAQSAMRPPYDQEEAGDWLIDDSGNLIIRIVGADLAKPETFLFALHELVEAMMCLNEGISQQAVDAFDVAYTGEGEPGDDPEAAYRTQHRRAMLVEHLMANFMGLSDYGTVE